MPNLRGICTAINSSLKSSQFSPRRFQAGSWDTIAYLVTEIRNEETIKRPVLVDNNGDGTDVTVNDTYPIQFYHRNLGISEQDAQEDGFGDAGKDVTETADMVLICMGNRTLLGVFPEDVASAIWGDIPRELPHATLQALSIMTCSIVPGEVSVVPEDVWAQEYQGTEFALPADYFMLSCRYKINTVYKRKCFTLCT
jgi:hypothetical protein